MRAIILILCQIYLIASGAVATAETAEICRAKYQKWLSTYGGSDPYQAIAKTTPWPLDPRLLGKTDQQIKVGNLQLPHFALLDEGRIVDAADALTSSLSSFERASSRDLSIRENLVTFLTAKPAKRTLKIAYVGGYHTIDLFISHPELTPAYLQKPFNENTPLYSAPFRRLQQVLNFGGSAQTVRDISASAFTLVFKGTLDIMKSNEILVLPARSFISVPYNPDTIIIGEIHQPDSSKWLDGLPSPDCIKLLGYESVEAAFEVFPSAAPLTSEYIRSDRTMRLKFQFKADLLGVSMSQFMQPWPEDVRRDYLAGKIIDNTAAYRLTEIVDQYEKAGIQTRYMGLEAFDFDIFAHIRH